MKVAGVLKPDEGDSGDEAEDVALERETGRRERARPREADQVGDDGWADRKQLRPILERLHRPALDAAGEGSRDAGMALRRRRRDSGGDRSENDHQGDERHPPARSDSHRLRLRPRQVGNGH